MPMRMKDGQNGQKDKVLHVSCEGRIGVAFEVALFGDVYTDTAALVIQSERGMAILRLFDPYAPAEDVFAGGCRRARASRCTATTTSMALSRRTTICAALRRCRRARRCTSSVVAAACGGGVASRTRQVGLTGRGEPRPFFHTKF